MVRKGATGRGPQTALRVKAYLTEDVATDSEATQEATETTRGGGMGG